VLGTMEQSWRMVKLGRVRPTLFLERMDCECYPASPVFNYSFQNNVRLSDATYIS
jgi:hypothetical protein